jgi:solute carrier family 29 (equilibrative nucleoside transporter), member 1/2/3
VLDLIGRYIPLLEHIKLTSRKGLMISSVLQCLLVPAFYYTVKYGDQGWMIASTSILGLSNGYLTIYMCPNGGTKRVQGLHSVY